MRTLKLRISAVLLAALMGLFFAVPIYADWDDFDDWTLGQELYVVGCEESITLRRSPSISAPALTQIPYMDPVVYLSPSSSGFSYVDYKGQKGYVLSQYLDCYEPQIAIGVFMTVTNCRTSITLREKPSTNAAEICQIPLGATVYVDSFARSDDSFFKVYYNGFTGYVLGSYLSQ